MIIVPLWLAARVWSLAPLVSDGGGEGDLGFAVVYAKRVEAAMRGESMKLWLVVAIVLVALPCVAVDVPIPGRVTVVKPGKITKFVSKSDTQFVLPSPGSGDDPTLSGADLRFFDLHPFGGGEATYGLDASGWKGLGNPPGSKGYKYRGSEDVLDPDPKGTCRVVVLKERTIKAVCKGDAVTLSTPFAGREEILLGIPAGSASLRYCAEFGGAEKRNDDRSLKRLNASAPVSCEDDPAPACGGFVFGECPAPLFCAVFPPDASTLCVPTFCTGGGVFPTCGGTCSDGWECKPLRVGNSFESCACSPPQADCNSICGGYGCPDGEVCQAGALSEGCGCEPL